MNGSDASTDKHRVTGWRLNKAGRETYHRFYEIRFEHPRQIIDVVLEAKEARLPRYLNLRVVIFSISIILDKTNSIFILLISFSVTF